MTTGFADILGRPTLRNIATDYAGWERDVDRVIAAWLARCPVTRAMTIYIQQDAAGNAAGGAGSGTQSNPYRVNTLNDLSTLVADMLAGTHPATDLSGGDAAILLRRDDTYAWDGTTTGIAGTGGQLAGVVVDVPHVTLAAWGAGEHKPRITGWMASRDIAPGTAWTQDATHPNTYSADAPASNGTIAWAGIKDDAFDWPLLERAPSIAALNDLRWGWFHDTANDRLHVNLGGGMDPDASGLTVQLTIRNSIAGVVLSADGCRVHGLRVEAMGLDDSNPNNQADAFKCRVGAEEVGVITACDAHIGAGHLITLHKPGASPPPGGRFYCADCTAGYALLDGATIYNAYHTKGGMQVIWDRCTVTAGVLPGVAAGGASGSGFFGHHGGGDATDIALWVQRDCIQRRPPNQTPLYGMGNVNASNIATPATLDDVKAFRVRDVVEGNAGQVAHSGHVTYAARITLYGDTSGGSGTNFMSNRPQDGWLINAQFTAIPFNMQLNNAAYIIDDLATAKLWHNHIHVIGRDRGAWHLWEIGDDVPVEAVNNIWTTEQVDNPALGVLDDPAVLRHNAYGPSIAPGHYDADAGAVMLTVELTPGYMPGPDDPLVAGSTAVMLSHDMRGRRRSGTPTIGPLTTGEGSAEARPAGRLGHLKHL